MKLLHCLQVVGTDMHRFGDCLNFPYMGNFSERLKTGRFGIVFVFKVFYTDNNPDSALALLTLHRNSFNSVSLFHLKL